jgi:class 3 adenylate cyclase
VIEVELPTGTVTLLFTDIEGSTRMLRSLGDDYGAVLRAHRTILRDVVGRHGGVEFGTEGDACFLAFPAAGPPWPRPPGRHAGRPRLTPPARWADHGTNRTFGRGIGVATRG